MAAEGEEGGEDSRRRSGGQVSGAGAVVAAAVVAEAAAAAGGGETVLAAVVPAAAYVGPAADALVVAGTVGVGERALPLPKTILISREIPDGTRTLIDEIE